MDNNSTSSADSCPNTGGFKDEGFFGQPSFNFKDVWSSPTYNWHIVGWLACALLLLITWIVALHLVIKHLRHYYDPEIQRHKARIVLYPPVYASLAWAAYLRLDYFTTILFFAVLFESFAVYNLYACLQAYLAPYREEARGRKEELHTKVMFCFKFNLASKWGMHYRIITDILVLQYPIWSIADAVVSMITQSKGIYCGGSYSLHGAHVYLTIVNFASLSVILTALFTYLAVFHEQWKMGNISAHGMFWCVKGPIMVIFYIGELLLSGLVYAHVIKGTDGSHSADGLAWSAENVKNGLYVIIICVTMFVAQMLMLKFYNVDRRVAHDDELLMDENEHQATYGPNGLLMPPPPRRLSTWMAFVDAYLGYIPEFFKNVLCCGLDSYRLARKRMELKARKRRTTGLQDAEHMLSPTRHGDDANKETYYRYEPPAPPHV